MNRNKAPLIDDYESIGQVLDVIDAPAPKGSGNSSHKEGRADSWDLGLGYEGAYAAYTGGWAEGARKAYDLSETLRPRPLGDRAAFRRDVTGAFPNVGAHLAGAPNAMYRVTKKHAIGKPFVHLYMPIGYHCGINADTAFNRGCALVAVADALETAGCRCRITLADIQSVHGAQRFLCRFAVKDYGDRLDVDNLIFTAAHPAFFRRIIFALRERSPHDVVRGTTTHGGYGTPDDTVPDMDVPQDGHAVNVIFPRLERNGGTPKKFLSQMVASLPEELRTEIDGNA